ncbi:glutathione hydrolase-like YwrD proenzyme [Apostichopus japonicus]|uniref:glutathione hydrolase-like YwrD proenzyme n=1 Tax=Stichopus japonicus TaxID=307972 RepID=UPI003AB2D256
MYYQSRRSPVLGVNGTVACSQPLAAQIGIDILKQGGNAADAAVAIAAVLNVTEPMSTGLGGDCFCLFYDSETKQVKSINGSGRSPGALSLDEFHKAGFSRDKPPPKVHPLNITVPGAAAAWVDTHQLFGSGKLTFSEILQPAIQLATNGFPVSPLTATQWKDNLHQLIREENPNRGEMLINGESPRAGEIMKMPNLASTFQELATKGKAGFYEGRIAEAIVESVRAGGGVMTLDDLKRHNSTMEDPICTCFRGIKVWECPPNGQGITTLLTLNILEELDLDGLGPASPEYIHLVAEALKLSFSDSLQFCADPAVVHVPTEGLLSKEYARKRSTLINHKQASKVSHGSPGHGGDTVYFCAVDCHGNACSFTNSTYDAFGSGLVPKNCGFTLQNRGTLFQLQEDHPNCPSGSKRSFHTIIPSMLTRDEDDVLLAAYGIMGGFMQPQGQVQLVMNMCHFGQEPQTALDQPRFRVGVSLEGLDGTLYLEEGFPPETIECLSGMGHVVKSNITGTERQEFGRGQIITRGDWWAQPGGLRSSNPKVLWAGSDPRADGMAIAF